MISYLTLMYSAPRKRHAVRTDKDGEPVRKSSKKSKEPEKVAFGFAIAVADVRCPSFLILPSMLMLTLGRCSSMTALSSYASPASEHLLQPRI